MGYQGVLPYPRDYVIECIKRADAKYRKMYRTKETKEDTEGLLESIFGDE